MTLSTLQERSIIALAFDYPDFFAYILNNIKMDDFSEDPNKFIFTIITTYYNRRSELPTREMARDIAARYLTVDDPLTDEVIENIQYEIDPRNIDVIKEDVIEWLRERAYGILYSDEGIEAYQSHNYVKLHKMLESASSVQDIGTDGMWFFNDFEIILQKRVMEKFTTGFDELDTYINFGGPSRGEVFLFMAPTGVGKSMAMINTGTRCVRRGHNVLHVTMEMTKERTAERYVGTFTSLPINERFEIETKRDIISTINKEKATTEGSLVIYEYAPDDISIDTITALMDFLAKARKFTPDIVIIDYMELLLSRNQYLNRDDYVRQKHVSTELRQLAKKTKSLIISATQTNRGDPKAKEQMIELNRVAESYGKTMPVDYVVSINQKRGEYKPEDGSAMMQFYIAKNRNGPKFKTVDIVADYKTMRMWEGKIDVQESQENSEDEEI
ncbi:MAG: hypothetical protein GF411_13825 [Candidatus Lokiarchaeota archaeon]|nr:hypothetical protein [Candidatus Lokiarchaeota archaeon]